MRETGVQAAFYVDGMDHGLVTDGGREAVVLMVVSGTRFLCQSGTAEYLSHGIDTYDAMMMERQSK